MWFSLSNHSLLLYGSPRHWSRHLLHWWGWLVQQDLLAGCKAGSQIAAGLTTSSSFSVKNTTSFSHKNRATLPQLSRPSHSATFTWRYIPSFATEWVCIRRMSGVMYRNLPKYFPVFLGNKAQNSSQSDRQQARTSWAAKSHWVGQEGWLYNKLFIQWLNDTYKTAHCRWSQ